MARYFASPWKWMVYLLDSECASDITNASRSRPPAAYILDCSERFGNAFLTTEISNERRLSTNAGEQILTSAAPGKRKPSQTIQPISYTVRNGDSLSRIASRYSVSVSDLHRWNTIKGKYIQPGQKLKLYVDVTEQTKG